MILLYTTIFLVFTVIQAEIKVVIVASDSANERQVHLFGNIEDVITDEEVASFGLTNEDLKEAVKTYFGATPTDVYLHSPTPWGDLYQTYNWPQAKRVLKPIKARILGAKTESTIVLNQIFENNSTKTATFSAKIHQDVQNTVKSSWYKEGSLNTSLGIEYNFDLRVAAVKGKSYITYTSKWGENVEKEETVTVGSESGVEITLKPNEKVLAVLTAKYGVMEIQIDYEASLTGSIAVNYSDGHRGHHFWSFDVNSVMSAAGLQRTKKSTETIKLGYYSDSVVTLEDYVTDKILNEIPKENFVYL